MTRAFAAAWKMSATIVPDMHHEHHSTTSRPPFDLLVAFFTKKSCTVHVPSSRYPKIMSIHAQLSEQALMLLRKEEKKSRILSVVIACLVIALIAGILALFALPMLTQETPTIVTYAAELKEVEDPQPKKVVQQTQRKPSAPAQNMAKVIAANTTSPTAIPVPDVVVAEPSLQFGDDMDFGQGWGDDSMGGGGGFGSTNPGSGGLEGFYYALEHTKHSTQQKPDYKPFSDQKYQEMLLKIQSAGFPDSLTKPYYRAPKPLYLTNLAIPNTPSTQGPKLFGADWLSNGQYAKHWLAHYSGTVTVPRSGTYRFSGIGDNYLNVQIDGRTVLHFGYAVPKGWEKVMQRDPKHQGPLDAASHWIIRYGEWINLRAGQTIKIDIGIGDGGGWCGYLLQVEQKGTHYEKTGVGRPILPLFTTAPFSDDEIKEIQAKFPASYQFDFDPEKVLVFPVKR